MNGNSTLCNLRFTVTVKHTLSYLWISFIVILDSMPMLLSKISSQYIHSIHPPFSAAGGYLLVFSSQLTPRQFSQLNA